MTSHITAVIWLCSILSLPLISNISLATTQHCDAVAYDEERQYIVQIDQIIDGDTVTTAADEKVRLIGINTPEFNPQVQPYALAAKNEVRDFLAKASRIVIMEGEEAYDKYGRLLAHIYRDNNDETTLQSLAEHLLRKGLGFYVAVSPNTYNAHCLAQAEYEARQQRRGLWKNSSFYTIKEKSKLARITGGFYIVQGQVARTHYKNKTWRLYMDNGLQLIVLKKYADHFSSNMHPYRGKDVEARGWIRTYGKGKSRIASMNITHPSMLAIQ